jgi:hypothetical protein
MEKNWVKVLGTGYVHKARIVKAMLEEEGIETVEINKQDSSYMVGEVELYVKATDVVRARYMIDKHSL